MPIKVAAVGTGNVGRHALTQLIDDPAYELTGVWVSSAAKAGKDAGELAGLDISTGITATDDLDAILAAKPDCVVYTAMADNRLPEALEDYRRILAAGVNVVASAAVFLQYPWQVLPAELIAPLEDAAKEGNSSLFVNGIDPGFAYNPGKAWLEPKTVAPLPAEAGGLVVYTQDRRVARHFAEGAATLEHECLAEVAGSIAPGGLQRLCHGLVLDGQALPPIKVSWQSERRLRFALKGVRPEQVGAMCAAVGLALTALQRIRIGRLPLAKLPAGQWRYAAPWERF